MSHITDCLKVYQPTLTKVRVGKANDGGYVMCRGLYYDLMIGAGIAGENSWEIDALNHLPPFLHCEAYDPVNDPGQEHPRYHFRNEPVGYSGLREARNALIKMDTEGCEFKWLDKADMSHVAQFIVEFHDPNSSNWDWSQLQRLAETHYLVHFHGNNWSEGYLEIDGILVPQTMECTYVRKDLDPGLSPSKAAIPSHLDMPNLAHKPDLMINWAPFVNP